MAAWHNLWFIDVASPAESDQFAREQWQSAIRNIPAASLAHVCVAAILVAYCWSGAQRAVLLGWFLLVLAICFARFMQWWAARVAHRAQPAPSVGVTRIIWATAATGAAWGLASLLFIPGAPPEQQFLCLLLAAGSAAAAIGTSHSLPAASFGFIVAAMAPTVLALLMEPEQLYRYLSAMALLFMAVMLFYARNSFLSFVDTFRLRTQNLELADEAAAMGRAKSTFLANVSHEMRTPLNAIIGFAEVIKNGSFGEDRATLYQEYAGQIVESGHRLLSVINDILDLARAEAGTLKLQPAAVDLADIIAELREALAGRATVAGVRIAVPPPASALIEGDPALVRRALFHIGENAVKFTPPGGLVEVAVEDIDPLEIVIIVRDTGIGIPGPDIDETLQPFAQLDRSLARAHGGVGLGLPLTRRFVELHGGRLEIRSQVGSGTTVRLRLPRRLAPDRELGPVAAA